MKKVIAAGAIFLLASGSQLSYAETQKVELEEVQQPQQASHRDWAISGYIGMTDFDGDEKPDPYQPERRSHEMESDAALTAGVILSKYYKDFSFNLGIEYIQEVTVEDEDGNELSEHSHIPISLGVNYHFYTNIVDPYIGAGIGYSFNDSSDSEFIANQGMSAEVDDSMFYFLTAGVEYPVNDKYALFLAGQYIIGDADMKGTIERPEGTFVIEDEANMDRYEVNVGVKYFF
ncbi:MAG: OmpW family outer membrane protein [Candidatus Electrothrix sp. GW3-4]|uniref:OmpW family outer membrane protein n=1 Tax=Candidatus Electrothrix sp. GW3-4 TaxID=3126740 RepID=UPI0030CDAEFB